MAVELMGTDDKATAAKEAPCRLLIADDQPHILEALRLLLKPEGYELEMKVRTRRRWCWRRWRMRTSMVC